MLIVHLDLWRSMLEAGQLRRQGSKRAKELLDVGTEEPVQPTSHNGCAGADLDVRIAHILGGLERALAQAARIQSEARA